jgi:DNA-binding Lrp family transcriptional regulator
MDKIDEHMIRLLRADGRISNADLAERVGLSPSACLRRLRLLESRGVIRGYSAIIDEPVTTSGTIVIVQITLERQTDECFTRFETAARRCAEIRECYLMTGAFDYQLTVVASDTGDYERIHKDLLSRLPGVVRIQSNFAIRRVIQAPAR